MKTTVSKVIKTTVLKKIRRELRAHTHTEPSPPTPPVHEPYQYLSTRTDPILN